MNDQYQVNVSYDCKHGFDDAEITWLSIKRIDKEPVRDWRDFQTIKNMICGPEFEAIEVFPAESRLVDTANQYHLWVFNRLSGFAVPQIPVGFTERHVSGSKEASAVGAKQRSLEKQ